MYRVCNQIQALTTASFVTGIHPSLYVLFETFPFDTFKLPVLRYRAHLYCIAWERSILRPPPLKMASMFGLESPVLSNSGVLRRQYAHWSNATW